MRLQTISYLALSLSSSFNFVSSLSYSSSDWTNVNYVKTIDLGGTVTHALYNLVLEPGQSLTSQSIDIHSNLNSSQSGYPYILSLSKQKSNALSSSEVTVKLGSGTTPNQRAVLDLIPLPQSNHPSPNKLDLEENGSSSTSKLYAFYLPTHLLPTEKGQDLVVNVAMTLNHVTSPLPKTVEQNGEQKLVWQDDVGLRSVYKTKKGRTKVQ